MSTVNVTKLGDEIPKNLEIFKSVTVEIMEEAVNEAAQKTVEKLQADSPHGRRGGKYAKGWTWKKDSKARGASKYSVVVRQKGKEYALTHLLEHGHALVRGGRKVGSSPKITHIAPAEEYAADLLFDEIVSRIERSMR